MRRGALQELEQLCCVFGLKAFSSCLPQLVPYFEKSNLVNLVLRSIGRLAVLSPRNVLTLGKRGIDLITRPSPDDVEAFSDPEIDRWLAEIKKSATLLKLPSSQIPLQLKTTPVSDLLYVRDWEISIPSLDAPISISDLMFSHVVTILESLGQDWGERRNRLKVDVQAAEDWRMIRLCFEKSEWSRLHLEQTIDQLWQHAFFSGSSDSIKQRDSQLCIEIKGLFYQSSEPYVHAYVDIMGRLYGNQSSFRSLYRIIHDLKNQIIAVRNYASTAATEGRRYQTLAAIEQLQHKIRDREAALTLFFKAADQVSLKRTNLKRTIRDFIAKQIPTLPDSVQLEFTDNLDRADVTANEELLVSLLENLSLNAIDAMPNGGRLSILATYKCSDAMLELVVADTGVGIPGDALPELFTSLKTTKATGMGLGLATVKQIVDQHDGLIDVTSILGKGTKFTVLLPLQRGE